ncbi:flavin-dependent dehydrogenase [Chitinivorax tropicus]|uniref:Flavin-dependent dehydrogenase n=1 Tax=Chitinivorax tropicus TaxID=714531 RepID=A0A840MKJ5_9PROT|nr:tryptophan 7-halogenase [Chitinivorax tropicus]MBB5019178.1 flavin-dependent dehydrogenase [Chitinivorax tropicus]
MLRTDVLILGAGPAGATAALNLAGTCDVLMVERLATPTPRIGESLPSAASRLLANMGLWEDFQCQGYAPSDGNRSAWNGIATEQGFLHTPNGHGWHLERAKFERWLRQHALDRGAALLTTSIMTGVTAHPDGWTVQLNTAAGACRAQARILIDASGRSANLARKLGARQQKQDKLVCGWLYGRDPHPTADTRSLIESTAAGWWYTASLPDQQRVLAFHTDSDLPAARAMRTSSWLKQQAMRLETVGSLLKSSGFTSQDEIKLTAAHSAILTPGAGPRWFAVGDAALSFNPLSSQGLFNALYTGLAAANATHRMLQGDPTALADYQRELTNIANRYQRHLDFWYGEEQRWAGSLFWQRRQTRYTHALVQPDWDRSLLAH